MLASGCDHASGESLDSSAEAAFPDKRQIDRLPYERANLILSGTAFPVDVVRFRTPDGVRFELRVNDRLIESEAYSFDRAGFRLSEAAGATYVPPIPLLRFPLRLNESWTWGGEVREGESNVRAAANVRTTPETLNVPGGPYESTAVTVDVRIRPGEPYENRRKLRFWIVPKAGVVKREFGSSSTREPEQRTR